MTEEHSTAWVIERDIEGARHYWSSGRSCWSKDHQLAIRFTRESDAETLLEWMLSGHGQVVKHLWNEPQALLSSLRLIAAEVRIGGREATPAEMSAALAAVAEEEARPQGDRASRLLRAVRVIMAHLRTVIDRQVAEIAEMRNGEPMRCKASASKTDPPQDCDWPVCGCDAYAEKVIAAIEESGLLIRNKHAGETGNGKMGGTRRPDEGPAEQQVNEGVYHNAACPACLRDIASVVGQLNEVRSHLESLGLTPDATIQSVQRRLHVGAADAMRLLELFGGASR